MKTLSLLLSLLVVAALSGAVASQTYVWPANYYYNGLLLTNAVMQSSQFFAVSQLYNSSVTSTTDTATGAVTSAYNFWDGSGGSGYIYNRVADAGQPSGFSEECRATVSGTDLSGVRTLYPDSPDCAAPVINTPGGPGVAQVAQVVCETSDDYGTNTITYTITWWTATGVPQGLTTNTHYVPAGAPEGSDFSQTVHVNEIVVGTPDASVFQPPAICASA